MSRDDARQSRQAAVADLVWTGQEVLHLQRFRDNLNSARSFVGHDDDLANAFLADALEDLQCLLGDAALPVGPRATAPRRPAGLTH